MIAELVNTGLFLRDRNWGVEGAESAATSVAIGSASCILNLCTLASLASQARWDV